MFTREDDINITALLQQGGTISAIAGQTGRDRMTIRAYPDGTRTPGVRANPAADSFDRFVDYISARLNKDPRLWSLTLFDELQGFGFTGSCPILTRQLRVRKLRPV